MHSIRFKITAITIVAMLTTVAVVFLASFSTIQAQNDRTSVKTMGLMAHDTGKSLEKYTEGIEQSIGMIANIATSELDSVALVKGGVAGSAARRASQAPEQVAQLDAYLARYCADIQGIASSEASHTHGINTYYYCIRPEVSATEHGFFYSNVGKTGFVEREPLDARQLDPADTEHTAWYYEAIERGRPSWVGPYKAHFLDEMWICSYIVPIYKAGTLIGLIGMDIPIDTLVEQVSSIQVYDTGFACLLDSQGRVIYHPELEFGSTLDASVAEVVSQQEDSGDALIRYTAHGEERQMSFMRLSNGMKLVMVAPTAEVNAASTQLANVIIPITVVIIVVFAFLIMVVMRFITTPLLRLTSASQRLAAADYDVELGYDSRDEVGALTRAFQQMRDQLKENIDDLNRRVRTDDLTGLANQRYFYELVETQLQGLMDEGKHPVALYFNLVGMKHFNHQYGFAEGDALICGVAEILAKQFGDRRTSRFAQDHFAVLADEDRLEERLQEVFEECRGINGGKSVPVSVGIYQSRLGIVGASAAFDRAKYACDRRRGSYISGFRYFDADMISQVELMRHVINHLDQALEEQWVQVYYQPIVRAANGKVCDEEALSRWVDPERGFLSPGHFIPALEEAGLIYKLDLYMLDQVLEKMQLQKRRGFPVVPHSINLSRSDFEACDIVEEIRRRVDAAGFGHDKITIEITESIIGGDFDFMKGQVERFRRLGFPVWMDDFGSGYSSLDVLQSIQFDLIKFDMSFMRKLDEGESGKIILTELMRMANSLGVDTVCEGVETDEQRRFLQEIGCSKLQGYLFCKPISLPDLIERYNKGDQIGFENPEESAYYEAISRLNLYDLAVMASDDEYSFHNAFNSLPMAVVEMRDGTMRFVRTNRSYRDFLERFFGVEAAERAAGSGAVAVDVQSSIARALRECCATGNRIFVDGRMPDGSIAHSIVRRIHSNPVTDATAAAIAVLSITDPNEGATYAGIARALALDYYNIYCVDLDTERFIEYRSPVGGEDLVKERHGENFFAETVEETKTRMYAEDRAGFLARFTKENILRDLDERGVYTASYRLVDTGTPMMVNMKVTRMEPGGHRVIMGISIVDVADGN